MWPFDHVFASYSWPGPFGWYARSLHSNFMAGLLQTAVLAVGASLIWPRTRHAIERFVNSKLRPIHQHLRRAAAHDAWSADLHAKIAHSRGIDVPDHPEHGAWDHDGGRGFVSQLTPDDDDPLDAA